MARTTTGVKRSGKKFPPGGKEGRNAKNAKTSGGKKFPPGPAAAVSRERAKLLRAQAERTMQRTAQAKGELVSAEDVAKQWEGVCRLVRSRLLAVAQRHPEAAADIRAALTELGHG